MSGSQLKNNGGSVRYTKRVKQQAKMMLELANRARVGVKSVGLVLMIMCCPWVQAKSLNASVDRNTISISDTFTLSLEARDLGVLSQPDFTALAKHFDILSKNVSHNLQNINGVSSQSVTWQLQLQAKQLGDARIPSFSLQGVDSQPIKINVTKAQLTDADNADFQLTITSSKQQLKVNEQTIIKLKLLYAKNISSLQSSEMEIANAQITALENQEYETQIQGKKYGVFEISYAVFPTAAGVLEIPAQQIAVGVGRRSVFNNSQSKVVRLASQALQIPVSVVKQGNGVLVADQLALSQKWSLQGQTIDLGESITREISLQLKGALAATVPVLAMEPHSGLKIYPEVANKSESKAAEGVVVKRSRKFAIVPTQAGIFELPALEYQWWNATEQKMEVARLPAKRIEVLNPVQQSDQQPVIAPPATPEQLPSTSVQLEKVWVEKPLNQWLVWLNASFFIIIVILSSLLFKAKSRTKPKPLELLRESEEGKESSIYQQLINAVDKNDATQTDQLLLRWTVCLGQPDWLDAGFNQSVIQLRHQLYAANTTELNWANKTFKQQLQAERKLQQANSKQALQNSHSSPKSALYPN